MKRKSDRIRAEAGWVKKGHPSGTCRLCGGVIDKLQDPYCRTFHKVCATHWKITSQPGYVRQLLYERDRGICSRCGLDTDAVSAAVRELQGGTAVWRSWGLIHGWLAEQRLTNNQSMWEAHHTVAVVEGGGGCTLDGYETCCRWCHRRETAELAARRAQKRKEAKCRATGTNGTDSKPAHIAAISGT